ncbi:MAG: carboxypeptidase regulatory-like domain-containing protein [Bacteroidetes bacterium]|nr:carboxypeptidase regulatory-like domain-containing protein [Bacteroidota bacterium]
MQHHTNDGGFQAAVVVRRRRLGRTILLLTGAVFVSCVNDPVVEELPPVISGSAIIGTLSDSTTGGPLAYTRVRLLGPGVERLALTSAAGEFRFSSVVPATYRVTVDRAGYDSTTVEVPSGVRDTSRVRLAALRRANVPPLKPLGTGRYRIEGRLLHEDVDRDGIYSAARINGVAFSPTPIGGGTQTPAMFQRAFQYLDTLNANTIRTYSGATDELLRTAASYGVRVIVGYWVLTDADMADPVFRQNTVRSFREMVRSLRSYPAVLFWNLGNEQNLPHVNGDTPLWYDLAEELAVAAFEEEGTAFHPVCISNGGVTNIGDPAKRADDASLRYVDLWASNLYRLDLTSSFAQFRGATSKPIVLTEFGVDAFDHRIRQEFAAVQTLVDSMNWSQILSASDVCIGGTVFEYTDEWWKAGDPLSHNDGGYFTNQHPDGYSNEEWWGLIAVTPDTNADGMDEWRPRSAFRMFQRQWQ